MNAAEPRPKPRTPATVAGGVALVAVATFALCLRNDLVYDDVHLLLMDDRIGSPSQWGRYLTESYNGGVDNLYRPLVSFTYAVQWWLHGNRPAAFFAVNVALHAVASVLVARLVGDWPVGRPRRPWAGLLAGLIFAVHPVHAEVVATVVGRAESMCATFFLGALLLASGPLSGRRALAVWACAIGAMLSKEQGLLLPAVLLLMLVAQGRANPSRQPDRRGLVLLLMLICWTWAGYVLFRESTLKFWWDRTTLDWVQQPLVLAEGVDRWLMPLALLGRYVALFFWPARLSLDYGGSVIGWQTHAADAFLWIGIVAVVAWAAWLAWAIRRRDAFAVVCLLSAAVTYGLSSNLLTLIGTNFAERLVYLPSAFATALLVRALTDALPARAAVVVVALLSAAGAMRTVAYVRHFDDRLQAYRHAVETQPKSVRLRMLLASELVARGRLDEAAEVARRAVETEPDYQEPYILAAAVELERRDPDAAEVWLRAALGLPRLKTPAKVAAYLDRVVELRAALAEHGPATRPR